MDFWENLVEDLEKSAKESEDMLECLKRIERKFGHDVLEVVVKKFEKKHTNLNS